MTRLRGERPRECEVSGHSLRVSTGQHLLADGHELAAIMRAGGWSEASTAIRYVRLAEHNIWAHATN